MTMSGEIKKHIFPLKSRIIGEKRFQLGKEAINETSNAIFLKQFETLDDSKNVLSLNQIQKAKSDLKINMDEYEMHKQTVDYDISVGQGTYIKSITSVPFSVSFYEASQLKYLKDRMLKSDDNTIIYCDFTGNTFILSDNQKKKERKRMLHFTMAIDQMVSIGDFLTTKATSKVLSKFLTEWKSDFLEKNKTMPKIFVSDYSWPIINSILSVFLETDIRRYLQAKYDELRNGRKSDLGCIFWCELHTCKFMYQQAKKLADKDTAIYFCQSFMIIFGLKTLNQIGEWWKHIVKYFSGI